MDDINKNGLRTMAGGYETGKLFGASAEDAAKFGKNNFKLDGIENYVIRVDVPGEVMREANKFRADFMDAFFIPADRLDELNSVPMNYSPVVK
ncbi:hypothetical protein GN155_006385 [Alcanivorax sp. ZXX171]|nr:hypothetical protein [Alcanivorax sp. ZXX171]